MPPASRGSRRGRRWGIPEGGWSGEFVGGGGDLLAGPKGGERVCCERWGLLCEGEVASSPRDPSGLSYSSDQLLGSSALLHFLNLSRETLFFLFFCHFVLSFRFLRICVCFLSFYLILVLDFSCFFFFIPPSFYTSQSCMATENSLDNCSVNLHWSFFVVLNAYAMYWEPNLPVALKLQYIMCLNFMTSTISLCSLFCE